MAMRELGRRGVSAGRFAAPEDVTMLLESELDSYVTDPELFVPIIAERLKKYRALFEIEPPFIIDADPSRYRPGHCRSRPRPPAARPGDVLRGHRRQRRSVPGRRSGRARPGDGDGPRTRRGDGRAAHRCRLTPLFLVAGAVVVDVGALNSHAVVRIARARHPVRAVPRRRHPAAPRWHATDR